MRESWSVGQGGQPTLLWRRCGGAENGGTGKIARETRHPQAALSAVQEYIAFETRGALTQFAGDFRRWAMCAERNDCAGWDVQELIYSFK